MNRYVHADKDCSQMGHGRTHLQSHPTRDHRISEAILRLGLGLQPRHVIHKVLHPATISTHLSATRVPACVLYFDGCGHGVHFLDILQRGVRMLADFIFLEPTGKAWWWTLYQSIWSLVSLTYMTCDKVSETKYASGTRTPESTLPQIWLLGFCLFQC